MKTIGTRSRLFLVASLLSVIAVGCGGETVSTSSTTIPGITQLAGLNVIDDYTFTVQFEEADPEFPLKLAYAAFFPMPFVAFEDPVAFEEQPVGNGPFEMSGTWNHHVEIPLAKYENYKGPDKAQVDNLTFVLIDDLNTAYNEVLSGNIDVLGPAIPTEVIDSAPTDFGDRYGSSSSTSFNYLGFPRYLEGFTVDHWRALSMAIDKETLVEELFGDTRIPAFSAIPPIFAGARDDVCDTWNYNPELAAQLWEQAGPIDEVEVWFNSGGGHELWVEAVANMWRNTLGVETTFQSLEFSEYLPLLDGKGMTGPFRLAWGQDYPSPLNFLEPLYASYMVPPTGSNSGFYINEEFDAKLAEGKAAVAESGELEDGLKAYQEAEDILCADPPLVPMFFRTNQFVWTEGTSDVFYDSYSDLGVTKVKKDDDHVRVHLTEPEHLFPTNSNESQGIQVLRALFTGLVQYDAETNEPFNAHAESITSEDGGVTWTIKLKKGWEFHDGEPVTAWSYVNAWSYGATGANAQQNNGFYMNIVGYDELNPEVEEG